MIKNLDPSLFIDKPANAKKERMRQKAISTKAYTFYLNIQEKSITDAQKRFLVDFIGCIDKVIDDKPIRDDKEATSMCIGIYGAYTILSNAEKISLNFSITFFRPDGTEKEIRWK